MTTNWLVPPSFSAYWYAITKGGLSTAMLFAASFPADESVLTQANADNLAAGLRTSILAVSGVTVCTQSTIMLTGSAIAQYPADFPGQLIYSSAAYTFNLGKVLAIPTDPGLAASGFQVAGAIMLLSQSPGDGRFAAADITALAASLSTAASALGGVVATVTMAPQSFSPAGV